MINFLEKSFGFMDILHINKHMTSKNKQIKQKTNLKKKNLFWWLLENLFFQASSSSLQKRKEEGNTNQHKVAK
jgi:hypothetical protein